MPGRGLQVIEARVGHSGEEVRVGIVRRNSEHPRERAFRCAELAAFECFDAFPIFGGRVE